MQLSILLKKTHRLRLSYNSLYQTYVALLMQVSHNHRDYKVFCLCMQFAFFLFYNFLN